MTANANHRSIARTLLPLLQPWLLVPALLGGGPHLVTTAAAATPEPPPNIVIIFADDLGYGDLGCYGHPSIRTPNLDRMAAEGLRFTDFYSAASVCTPSRAALMTGRLPVRSGMCSDRRRVLFPDSAGGIPASEITLAEALKTRGYTTGCVGKWHLGHLPEFLPTRHGFDEYFGLPYSNDMDRTDVAPRGRSAFLDPSTAYWNVPLLRNDQVIERPARQETLTRRYTDEAVGFIRRHKSRPFFLYFPHTFPHVPLFASDSFHGRSARGLYGDTVEELDWSVGRVLDALRSEGLAERTLVFFTSDNGPWLTQFEQGGSAGLLREGKGSTWDGGMREPAIAWWPGRIRAGRVTSKLGSTLDLFATSLSLAGAPIPDDRIIDGVDLSPVLFDTDASPRETMFFYRGTRLYAVRHGAFKAHWITQSAYGTDAPQAHNPPLLFHLGHDPSEQYNLADKHPDILQSMAAIVELHQGKLNRSPTQLEGRLAPAP